MLRSVFFCGGFVYPPPPPPKINMSPGGWPFQKENVIFQPLVGYIYILYIYIYLSVRGTKQIGCVDLCSNITGRNTSERLTHANNKKVGIEWDWTVRVIYQFRVEHPIEFWTCHEWDWTCHEWDNKPNQLPSRFCCAYASLESPMWNSNFNPVLKCALDDLSQVLVVFIDQDGWCRIYLWILSFI